MTTREATCACGQLRVACEGEPVRVSVCHCLECQKRTGSIFGAQARFPDAQITKIEGAATTFARKGDRGTTITFNFCPTCGATVYYRLEAVPGFVVVALGAFADPTFPGPTVSIYEARQHTWVTLDAPNLEHMD